MSSLAQTLYRRWQEQPEAISLVLLHTGQPDRTVSYQQLLEGAARFALTYEKAGIAPGEVMVLIMQHGLALIEAYWGAILHGAIPSIMPFLTEKLVPERYRQDLAALIQISQPAGIVTYSDFEDEVRAALRPEDSVRAVLVSERISQVDVDPDWHFSGLERQSEDIVLLQHSSGTTGLQKGVALSNQAVLNQLESYAEALSLNPKDVIVSWLPLYHDMGLIAGFLQPILSGIKLVLMSPFEWVRAPQRLFQAVSTYRGTLTWLPNFAYNFCTQKVRERHLEGVDLSSWRAVINCSEPMRAESHERFYARFQPFGLRAEALVTCYAMAENVFAVTQSQPGARVTVDLVARDPFQTLHLAQPASEGQRSLRFVSAGKTVPGTAVKVLGDQGQELAERQVGEIAIRSNCMLSGYYHRPDETAKAFLDGWYLTGDFGYVADGQVYITGRKKDLLIIGGKNVYPQDLESLAMEVEGVHPGRVVAFGVFDEDSGTEEAVIAAEVETENEQERERIADEIQLRVTRESAIALRTVYLVGPKWLLKTSSGKIARLANRDKYLAESKDQGAFQGK
jgi:fatty-acyl-CoA synthase